jgi:hypothetical protein
MDKNIHKNNGNDKTTVFQHGKIADWERLMEY